jgi:hypothetical protein
MILRKVQVRLDPIAFGPVLSEALDAVRPTAGTEGIDHRCEWAARDLVVLADGERLLRVSVAEGAIVLEVEDTGIGIAPDLLPHIFGQIEAARPGEGGGSTFTGRLPVLESRPPVPAERAR